MKTRKFWSIALLIAMACLAPGQGFCEEVEDEDAQDAKSSRRVTAQETSLTNSWYAEPETVAPPAPDNAAPAATSPNTCCDLSAPCCPPQRSIIAMAEATFFWPQFHRGFLNAGISNDNGQQQFASNSATGSTDGTLLVGPRITLGVQGECWGIVGRYWNANSWATAYAPANPQLLPAGVTSFDNFSAYTADIEVQRRFCLGNWSAYGFLGTRYASVNNDRSLVVSGFNGAATMVGSSLAMQQFNGTGLTFGFWGTRPVYCDCSPLKYYFANRYSILWGNGSAVSQTSATVTDNNFATSTNGALASGRGDMFIGEVQLGLQWDAQLKCFPGRAFIRSGIEYQYWDSTANVFTSANSFAVGANNNNTANGSASAGDFLFSLVGFNLGAGIMY